VETKFDTPTGTESIKPSSQGDHAIPSSRFTPLRNKPVVVVGVAAEKNGCRSDTEV